MLNLLPKDSRKEIKGEYRLRVAVVGAVFVLVISVCAGLFLLPSYIFSISRENIVHNRNQELLNIQTVQDNSQGTVALIKAQNELTLIQQTDGTTTVFNIVNQALAHRTAGISITSISVVNKNTVSLVGVAVDRPSLVAFSNALEADPAYANVNVPISDFSKDENIPFSLSFSLK